MTVARDERGSLVAFLAVLAAALFALAGLVVDGGRALAARQTAAADAEQAARAGAQAVSASELRRGSVRLDAAAARRAADAYLRAIGATGTVAASGTAVTVTVRIVVPSTILGVVGVRAITVGATATATDLHGVTRED